MISDRIWDVTVVVIAKFEVSQRCDEQTHFPECYVLSTGRWLPFEGV